MKDSNLPIFSRSDFDDLGLSASEYRIYCRIARRGKCYETVKSMAQGCRLHADTVRMSIKSLQSKCLISVREQPGSSNELRILPYRLGGIPKIGYTENKGGDPMVNKGGDPTENKGDKGNPPKEIPSKKSLSCEKDFDEFWKAYPRKVSKQNALKAFKKIKNVPLAKILKAIESQKVDGGALSKEKTGFIPHAATWLNGERWNDEPESGSHHEPPKDSWLPDDWLDKWKTQFGENPNPNFAQNDQSTRYEFEKKWKGAVV